METLSNLIRLSYWSRIKSVVPASFHELLPPAPEVQPVPRPPEAPAAQDGAEPMADAGADERDAATKRAFEMLTMVRALLQATSQLSVGHTHLQLWPRLIHTGCLCPESCLSANETGCHD